MRRLACVLVLGLAGCFGAPTPGQRLTDSAYEMNTAARFGRMDIALGSVAAKAKATGVSYEEFQRKFLETTSLHSTVSQQDIANMALFLCSPAGAKITAGPRAASSSTVRPSSGSVLRSCSSWNASPAPAISAP